MENASKALIIAGAILLSILIIAIGMYIYTSSQSTITDSMQSMSTQEIQAFNSNFETYTGKQTGSQVKALLTYCTANAKTYEDEPSKVPAIHYGQLVSSGSDNDGDDITFDDDAAGDADALTEYVQGISKVSNKLELKHTYRIVLTSGASGMIEDITIQYDPANFGVEPGQAE